MNIKKYISLLGSTLFVYSALFSSVNGLSQDSVGTYLKREDLKYWVRTLAIKRSKEPIKYSQQDLINFKVLSHNDIEELYKESVTEQNYFLFTVLNDHFRDFTLYTEKEYWDQLGLYFYHYRDSKLLVNTFKGMHLPAYTRGASIHQYLTGYWALQKSV